MKGLYSWTWMRGVRGDGFDQRFLIWVLKREL